MYCPKCKLEYRKSFTKCPDCQVDLVDQIPEEIEEDEVDNEDFNTVKIKTVSNEIEAGLILNLLQNNNIPCYKKSKGAGGYMNLYMGYSIYGEDIYVAKNDYQKAETILSELET